MTASAQPRLTKKRKQELLDGIALPDPNRSPKERHFIVANTHRPDLLWMLYQEAPSSRNLVLQILANEHVPDDLVEQIALDQLVYKVHFADESWRTLPIGYYMGRFTPNPHIHTVALRVLLRHQQWDAIERTGTVGGLSAEETAQLLSIDTFKPLLVKDPCLTAEQVGVLLRSDDEDVVKTRLAYGLGADGETPHPHDLWYVALNWGESVRVALASFMAIYHRYYEHHDEWGSVAELIRYLSRDPSPQVRVAIAECARPEDLPLLAVDEDVAVRRQLVTSRLYFGETVARILSTDLDVVVRRRIAWRIGHRSPCIDILADDHDIEVLERIAPLVTDPEKLASIAEAAIASDNWALIKKLLINPHTPVEYVERWIAEGRLSQPLLKKVLGKRDDLPATVAVALHKHRSPYVRQRVAQMPQCPDAILIRLMASQNDEVSHTARRMAQRREHDVLKWAASHVDMYRGQLDRFVRTIDDLFGDLVPPAVPMPSEGGPNAA